MGVAAGTTTPRSPMSQTADVSLESSREIVAPTSRRGWIEDEHSIVRRGFGCGGASACVGGMRTALAAAAGGGTGPLLTGATPLPIVLPLVLGGVRVVVGYTSCLPLSCSLCRGPPSPFRLPVCLVVVLPWRCHLSSSPFPPPCSCFVWLVVFSSSPPLNWLFGGAHFCLFLPASVERCLSDALPPALRGPRGDP